MMRDDGLSIDTSSDNVVVVDSAAFNTWDPFGGIAAPQGYTYIGKLAFICFSPASTFFASILVRGVSPNIVLRRRRRGG